MAPSTKTTYQERMERLTDDERAAHLAQARGYQRKHRERPLLTVTQRVQRLGEAFPLLDLMTIMSQSTAKLHALEQFEVTMSIENLNSKIQEHEDIIDGLQSDNTKLENANVGIEAQILTFARECRSVKSKNTNQIRINNANIDHAQQPLPRWANDLNELNQKSNFLGSALT
jgi:DnaJ-domain-containing protein 1